MYQQLNFHNFGRISTELPDFSTVCPIFPTAEIIGKPLFSFSFSLKNKKKEKESAEKTEGAHPRLRSAAYFLIHKFIARSTGFRGKNKFTMR